MMLFTNNIRMTSIICKKIPNTRQYISIKDIFFPDMEERVIERKLSTLDQPLCKLVKGRYVSPWSSKTEKTAFDILKYLFITGKTLLQLLDSKTLEMLLTCETYNNTSKYIYLSFIGTQSRLKLKNIADKSKLISSLYVNREKCKSITQPHCTWIGHATCYYQTNGVFFLTDPLWSKRASPVPFIGPKRYIDAPIEIEDLHIDVVLLSHTHYDHLDFHSAQRIGNKALWCIIILYAVLL